MSYPTWVYKIINFFCKLFHKNTEEESNKLKKQMCESAKSRNMCNLECDYCAWKIEENSYDA